MPELEGKVAFITGAARGQGRSHAVRLAQEGADIVAVDICVDTPSIDYPNASRAELDETAQLVEAQGCKAVALTADVRNREALQKAFDEGMSSFGRVDIVLANAGIVRLGPGGDPVAVWRDIIDTNLTGAWNTVSVALPTLRAGGREDPSSSPARPPACGRRPRRTSEPSPTPPRRLDWSG